MFNYIFRYPRYDDDIGRDREIKTPEIQYVPVKEEPKETKKDEGFKITIRKKPRDKFNSSGKVSQSFEKIFYTK